MDRPLEIALLARRFSVLSRRPDLLYADRKGLYERVVEDTSVPLTLLDKALLLSVEPIDRVCARAVQLLGCKSGRSRETVELLDVLDADHIVAIFFALPEDAKRSLRREPEWAWVLQAVQDDVTDAMADVDTVVRMIEGPPAVGQPRHDWLLSRYPQTELRDRLAETAEMA